MVFSVSCNNKKNTVTIAPGNVLKKDSMVVIMTDFRLVEGAIRQMVTKGENSQKMTKYYYSYILNKHKISIEDFNTSLKYYSKDPKQMDEIYSKVVANLNEKLPKRDDE